MPENNRPQWTMSVTIFHGPTFGHSIEVATETKGRPDYHTHDSIGSWRGVGIPDAVFESAVNFVRTVMEEHLITRYGVNSTLTGWEVERDPF